MSPLVTPLQRQTVASSGMRGGRRRPRAGCGGEGRQQQVCRVGRDRACAGCTPRPGRRRPPRRRRRWRRRAPAGDDDLDVAADVGVAEPQRALGRVVRARCEPHTPMVTTSRPCALSRTTSLPPRRPALGPRRVGAGRRPQQCAASRRDCSQPWATRPVPPSGGCAQSPIANTRRSSRLARSASTSDAAVEVRPAAAARAVLGVGAAWRARAGRRRAPRRRSSRTPRRAAVLDEDRLGADADAVVDARGRPWPTRRRGRPRRRAGVPSGRPPGAPR